VENQGFHTHEKIIQSVMDVISQAHLAVLIGVSGQPGLFTREMITEMAEYCARPLVATGGPFPPVE
jgi:malate dehydrogenase (oxaloacetate-decarboxylating)